VPTTGPQQRGVSYVLYFQVVPVFESSRTIPILPGAGSLALLNPRLDFLRGKPKRNFSLCLNLGYGAF
jgi:hypothetical protein